MSRYQGGSTVPGGYFLDLRHWSFKAVSGDEGQLPGDETSRYVKVPLIAVIPGVLLISLAFLVFFPFIGFALAGKAHGPTSPYGSSSISSVPAGTP